MKRHKIGDPDTGTNLTFFFNAKPGSELYTVRIFFKKMLKVQVRNFRRGQKKDPVKPFFQIRIWQNDTVRIGPVFRIHIH